MRFIVMFVAVVSVVLLGYVVETQVVNPPTTETPLVEFKAEPADTSGPVTYYVNNCARCHGQVDYAYREIKNPRLGEPLRQAIQHMAEGPAMAPLDAAGLEQQYDLHIAILESRPYAWLASPVRDVMTGETIPNTKIVLTSKRGRSVAQIHDYRFVLPNETGELQINWESKQITLPTGPR